MTKNYIMQKVSYILYIFNCYWELVSKQVILPTCISYFGSQFDISSKEVLTQDPRTEGTWHKLKTLHSNSKMPGLQVA